MGEFFQYNLGYKSQEMQNDIEKMHVQNTNTYKAVIFHIGMVACCIDPFYAVRLQLRTTLQKIYQ